jgi:DNA-binding LacI/PurR family transcriptional regulator
VSSDQVTDGIVGYNEIRRKGYRRIGLVRAADAQTRFVAGAAFQHRRAEGSDCPELTLYQEDADQDRDRLRQWIKKHKPDAIFTGVSNMRALLEGIGYRVPEGVGLAAFSVLDCDVDAGIDQNSLEVGQAAVQLLISLMHHSQRGIPRTCRELLVEGRWQDGLTLPPRKTAGKRNV